MLSLAVAGCTSDQPVAAPPVPDVGTTLQPRETPSLASMPSYDFTTLGTTAVINGARFEVSDFTGSTGTGVFDTFVRFNDSDGMEQGYNTSGRPVQYDEFTALNWTRDLRLDGVPVVTVGGVAYREFRLDINEPGTSVSTLSLDQVRVFLRNAGGFTGTLAQLAATSPEIYNMDGDGDTHVRLDYNLFPGSGNGDLRLLIPNDRFPAGCEYDGEQGNDCSTFVVLYSQMGVNVSADKGGFEEWSIRKVPFVSVTKTAATTYKRTYNWNLTKTATPDVLHLWDGTNANVAYQVVASPNGSTDSDWAVSGTITISNTSGSPATITSVADAISGGISPTVSCGVTFPYVLNNNAQLQCTYSGALPDGAARTNTATVALSEGATYTGTAAVTFGNPTQEVNKTVTVTDTPEGGSTTQLGTVTSPSTGTFPYNKNFACPADKNTQQNPTWDNTARIVETNQTATENVTVNCYALAVSKTAVPEFARSYSWAITKQIKKQGAADGTYAASAAYDMFEGDEGVFTYKVVATRSESDAQYKVKGVITIQNPATSSAAVTVSSVSDAIGGQGAATVTSCTGAGDNSVPVVGTPATHRTLGPGTSFTCQYEYAFASNPGTGAFTNTATAKGVIPTNNAKDFTGSQGFTFAGVTPSISGPATVNLTDNFNNTGAQAIPGGTNYASGTPLVYDRTQTCAAGSAGSTTNYPNVAAITETGQTAQATATIRCFKVNVSKTANTSLTRTWSWNLTKEPGTFLDELGQPQAYPNPVLLSVGQTFQYGYKVTVTASGPVESAQAAAGTITIQNPAPVAAKIASVTDVVTRSGLPPAAATVTGSYPTTIAAASSIAPTYTVDLSGSSANGTNTATASTQRRRWTGTGATDIAGTTAYTGTAAVTFPGTITRVNDCVNVYDDHAVPELLGTVCAVSATRPFAYELAPKSFTYLDDLAAPNACEASVNYVNIASTKFRLSDGSEGGAATSNATLNVLVNSAPCPSGCTLTRGYWQTHNASFGADRRNGRKGPPIHDWVKAGNTAWANYDAWNFFEGTPNPTVQNLATMAPYAASLPADLVATGNQPTWFQTFRTPPAGNPYYQASAQFMAALLNRANGAATPPAVGTALSEAWAFFLLYTPKTQWTDSQRASLIGWAGILAGYNEGTAGVRHCDEDASSALP
ncbi:hypothetical protein [Roseisolibacter sp. H3M3-2]|uniref:hypothetical protein n=1 Tax=Roseisolibacter sp. H3M3-2 TaxID=3031323 RepID=UPI0023DC33D7|nr:hypothetical protein [Roseisolibacter sp. H3M3-2]